jgi:hypothetical protein
MKKYYLNKKCTCPCSPCKKENSCKDCTCKNCDCEGCRCDKKDKQFYPKDNNNPPSSAAAPIQREKKSARTPIKKPKIIGDIQSDAVTRSAKYKS